MIMYVLDGIYHESIDSVIEYMKDNYLRNTSVMIVQDRKIIGVASLNL